VLFKQKKYKEASEWILKAVQNKEEPSAEVLEHYGDTLYKLGDASGALEYWLKAKQKGPASELLDKKITEKKYFQ
jgi:tetratricopeptide (TPR) repeat protein